MWMSNRNFWTSRTVSHNTFQMFIAAVGVEFLRDHGVVIDIAKLPPDVMDLELPSTPMSVEEQKAVELAKRQRPVFVQHKDGSINQFWDVDSLPEFVRDTLASDCLAVHDGELYGLSEMHLKGE